MPFSSIPLYGYVNIILFSTGARSDRHLSWKQHSNVNTVITTIFLCMICLDGLFGLSKTYLVHVCVLEYLIFSFYSLPMSLCERLLWDVYSILELFNIEYIQKYYSSEWIALPVYSPSSFSWLYVIPVLKIDIYLSFTFW